MKIFFNSFINYTSLFTVGVIKPTAVSTDTLTVNTVPNLSTNTKTENDGDDTVIPGQTVTYTITIPNTGNGMGTGIAVTEILGVFIIRTMMYYQNLLYQ
ncbi:hypothetical protein GF362_01730 [Candidatus Dojkabacteria bacterium]|nr:hypothetical protein [Candidatus Dojkabacteria bacterium]